MATIEPRLIHLLNESTATPRPPHAELPPIKALPLPSSSARPHPLEPDAGHRSDGVEASNSQLSSQSAPALYSVNTDDGLASSTLRKDNNYSSDRLNHVSSQDLRMILDDPADNVDELSTKKRPGKDDFPHLPQPLKRRKARDQQPMFPPIIVGLLEPPSNAALFPPISSGSFDDRPRSEPPQALSLSKPPDAQPIFEEAVSVPSPPADAERTPTGKVKRRATKPRRKWSEEETNHLLLGVSKHGVGRWTDILEDPEYRFNGRSAGDLKDRFRTCCPEELRASSNARGERSSEQRVDAGGKTRPKKGLMAENILNEAEEGAEMEEPLSLQNDSDSAPKQRKSRAHRKKMEDLAELGIKGPFKKSHRRERRPFSEQDDKDILEGFELYGPQWTKIQRDARFNLSSRQPTDLRDRLRNKYPDKFSGAEKTTMQVRESDRVNDILEPSVNMAIGNSLDVSKSALLEPQLNRSNSKDDMPRWHPSSLVDFGETSQSHSSIYWNEAGGFSSGSIGEMDISRLLLDDAQNLSEPPSSDKRGLG
ncbi:hypothetical protein F4778DRAFT_788072 [Xylariomycetidae sp. FL2044]|nr:hypothetical protein F4778DRAFT_788072 [Xylariomycetidae sp. FL2044]